MVFHVRWIFLTTSLWIPPESLAMMVGFRDEWWEIHLTWKTIQNTFSHILQGTLNHAKYIAQSWRSWKPCEMDLSHNYSLHGGKSEVYMYENIRCSLLIKTEGGGLIKQVHYNNEKLSIGIFLSGLISQVVSCRGGLKSQVVHKEQIQVEETGISCPHWASVHCTLFSKIPPPPPD